MNWMMRGRELIATRKMGDFGRHGISGYKGISSWYYPIREPPNRLLTPSKNRYNEKVSSDWIIVENYFGSLISLLAIFSHKWKWSEDNYEFF